MSRYRELLRPALLIQTGILSLSTLEATVVVVAGIGSPVPALLTAAATVLVGASARSRRLTRATCWTERFIVATFVVDTLIAMFTAGAALEPTVWVSRLVLPVFVLGVARSERKTRQTVDDTPERVAVPA